jgi:hypothetical protein
MRLHLCSERHDLLLHGLWCLHDAAKHQKQAAGPPALCLLLTCGPGLRSASLSPAHLKLML